LSTSRVGGARATLKTKEAAFDCYGHPAFRDIASPEFSCRLACVTTHNHTPTTEIGVLLTNDQIANLDQVAIHIRRNTGRAISRSAMIRAILSPVLKYHQQWLSCESEQQLRQSVANQLMRANQ
jgi:hypothetical protein